MAKSFQEAYLDSTDVLRDMYEHHSEFLGDGADIVGKSKVTEALQHVTISSDKYMQAAQMHLEFAAMSHASIGGFFQNGPDRESVTPKIYEGARQTYDHLNDHLDAMGAMAQAHHWSIGEQHPLTRHIMKNYHERKNLIDKYAHAWGFKDRFDFDDIMKNNNLNDKQFGDQ